jgi:hypothetical protein
VVRAQQALPVAARHAEMEAPVHDLVTHEAEPDPEDEDSAGYARETHGDRPEDDDGRHPGQRRREDRTRLGVMAHVQRRHEGTEAVGEDAVDPVLDEGPGGEAPDQGGREDPDRSAGNIGHDPRKIPLGGADAARPSARPAPTRSEAGASKVGPQARRARSERNASEVGQQARRARSERNASEVEQQALGRAKSSSRARLAPWT